MLLRTHRRGRCLFTPGVTKAGAYRYGQKSILGLLLFVLFFLASAQSVFSAVKSSPDKHLVLGVFPHFPPRTLEKIYAPIAADMSSRLGKTVKLRTSTSFEKFKEKLQSEEFDIAFLQPFDYVQMADDYGYLPLATRDEPLSTILVVPENSEYKKVEDLLGKTIALPPKIAAVSYLLKAHLRKRGIVPGKDIFISHHRSHVSCMQQVLIGAAQSCGTGAAGVRFFMKKMNVKMNVIMETSSIPHTLFTVHPRVSISDREILLSTILSLAKSKAGKEMLERGQLKPFKAIDDKAYDVVREFIKQTR